MRRATILILLLLSFAVTAAHAEERLEMVSAFWGTPEQLIDARPGDSKLPLTLLIQNKYSHVIIGIYAELQLPEGFHNVTGGNVASAAFGPSLPPGGVATLTFLINIDKGVRPGNYAFHLRMDYFDPSYSEMRSDFDFTLNVKPPIRLELSYAGWGAPQQPIKPVPGVTGVPLYLWITNPDTSAVYGVNLTLILPQGISGPNGERKGWATIPILEAGQSAMATFMLDIGKEVKGTQLEFLLKMEYSDRWFAKYVEERSFTLPIYQEPKVNLIVQGLDLEQASSSKLNVTVLNAGPTTIYDVLPRIQASGIFVLDAPAKALDSLKPGENASFTFELYAPSNLPSAPIPASAIISYKGPDGMYKAESTIFNINILPSRRLIEITPSTTKIRYQRLNEVVLNITNRSNRPLYDVEVSITPPAGLPLYIEEGVGPWRLNEIKGGSSKQITLHILPLAQAEGVVAITATATYRYGDTTRIETQLLLFNLEGFAEITLVDWRLSPKPICNGSRVSFSASLLNRGTRQAYYTFVYINASDPIIVDSMDKKYIGDLPVNSLTPFSLQFDVSPKARPGRYSAEVVVEYMDSIGRKYEVSWPIEISVTIGRAPELTREEGRFPIGQDLMIIIGLLALLIVAVIWGYRRRRRASELEVA